MSPKKGETGRGLSAEFQQPYEEQLNVLHQATSFLSRYDIPDIAIHVYNWKHHKRQNQLGSRCRQPHEEIYLKAIKSISYRFVEICELPLMWPVSGSPSRKTTMTSAAEFAGNGSHTSLPSHCLTASGSLPPFTWLCEKSPSRKSVDWHTQHVAKPAQPIQFDQFIYRGIADPVFPPDSGNAPKTSMVKH
ncbi:hypothetical protein T265_05458 [Opisthorchis viverrini]|uniref:Uncharacterized protein n=1 Tax=Opisthorchis viverrini TaxID=6198 RepID=A0A074ZNX1_OPIVI|nr:hypothetical protein T265_05458 [Opisthorchis viverrini]KER27497.1 hypothetical protein T265_05458 [Opisthorchis viverrini]